MINIAEVKKQFKVYSPLTTKSVEDFIAKSDGDRILLEGVASTTNRDLDDEVVSKTAIKSMVNQAPLLNLHGDHKYGLGDVIGAIKKAVDAGDEMRIQFLTTKKYTPLIRDLLETGVNLGLSIGGFVTKYDETTKTINGINLNEITLTPMPANWDTYGTVQFSKDGVDMVKSNCISGACHQIIKSLNKDEDKTADNSEVNYDADISELSEDEVIKLVNEFLTEKQSEITDEIVNKVSSQLETIVDAKIKQLKDELDENKKEDETPETPEPEEKEEVAVETAEDEEKAETAEEEDDDDEKAEKAISPEQISELIAKGISDALSDEKFTDNLAIKMFGELDKTRGNGGSKFDEYMKKMQEDETPGETEPPVKKTFSSQEASSILLKKQRISDPLTKAINQQLND